VLVTAWATLTVLVLANAFYVAAEFGAVRVRLSRVRRLAEDGNVLARWLLPFVERPAALVRYLSASQIGITLCSLTLGAYTEARFSAPIESTLRAWFDLDPVRAHAAGAALILIALTAVQLVIGELVPKSIALQHPTGVALATIAPMRWSLAVFRPFAALLNACARWLLRLFGATATTHRHVHSPEEIELLMAESRDGGLLEVDEHRRLRRALHLGLRTAHDLMVPLRRVTMLHVDTPWDEVVRAVAKTPFSRLPVYRETRQRVVGMLRVKDLIAHYASAGPVPLEQLIRPIAGVAADLPADGIVTLLRNRRTHQGVVVDSSGCALGLVTIQDVLNELLASAHAGRTTRAAEGSPPA
jgi:magnesium and cobalt exporter, CNNM family